MKQRIIMVCIVSLCITMVAILFMVSYVTITNWDDRRNTQLEYDEGMEKEIENQKVDQELNTQEISISSVNAYMLEQSSSDVPSLQDVKSSLAMISKLDQNDDWILGKFDVTNRKVISDDSYLSLNAYLPIESNNYRILVNDSSYRILINKYDKNNENLGYVDLCSSDVLNLDDSVKYITISIYKYENRQMKENYNQKIVKNLKSGLKFSITKVKDLGALDKEKGELSGEVHIESLSNFYNYRTGWYKSWGGAYDKAQGSLCTRSFYRVDSKAYIVNVNDSRIALSISEYDAKGKWVKYNDGLINGDKFTKQPSTEYIGITIRSKKWGVGIATLFSNKLRIDLASKCYMDKTDTIDFKDSDFSNTDRWKAGSYLYETGDYIIDPSTICYDSFCKIGNEEYVVNLPGGYLRMSILELTQDGKVVTNSNLQSGQRWKKSKNTVKIAITIYGKGKAFTVADYKKVIKEYPSFGLRKYVKYIHNEKMRDITAGEFINKVNVAWNLGNSLDSKSVARNKIENIKQELNWGNPYITKELIDHVKKSGFNTIRIPVTWYYNTYKDENGTLKIRKEWLNRVQEVVDYAIANDMYVILNTHHEQPILYTGTDNATHKQVLANAKALWTGIANHFKTYDEHLVFESYNEIDNLEASWNYSDKAATQMNELNQIFVDTVRATGGNNAKRILVVPTLLDGASSKFYSAFVIPKDIASDKIVVQVHIYTKKFDQDVEIEFSELKEFSDRIKAPILIGEFGTTLKYQIPELRAEQASNFVARAAKYGIKCVWWDNGSNYGIINRRDFSQSNHEMINALIEGGEGIGYQLDHGITLKNMEQFVYRMPNSKTGKLENAYWGTLSTENDDSAIPVQKGTYCTISLKAKKDASSIWLQRLLFYDDKGVLIEKGKEIQSKYYSGTIPANAVSMRVSMNSPNINLALKDYETYLNSGDLEMVIRFFDIKDVRKTKLDIMQYE